MNRNTFYPVIGVLAVAVAVFGYQLYYERQKRIPKGGAGQ